MAVADHRVGSPTTRSASSPTEWRLASAIQLAAQHWPGTRQGGGDIGPWGVGVLSATAMSWHGILLSETARLAPAGRAGAVTGGVLSFGQMGALLGPLTFALLLRLTGGYDAGWVLCTIPALWVGISLLRPRALVEGGKAVTPG